MFRYCPLSRQPTNLARFFTMTSSYRYSPLRSTRSIRLLILEASADENSVLKARVQDVSLDSPPLYEAISYVWGVTDSASCPASSVIQLEDESLVGNMGSINISPNCRAVLKRLRQHDEPKTLWIDAISIDQENIVEKSTQIPLMGEVYSKAYRALIWLGEPQSAEAEGVFNALPELSKVTYQEPNSISGKATFRLSSHVCSSIAFDISHQILTLGDTRRVIASRNTLPPISSAYLTSSAHGHCKRLRFHLT